MGGLMDAYLDAMRHYATFTGRTSRKGFWLFVLVLFILNIVAAVLDYAAFGAQPEDIGPIEWILHLVHFIPGLAIGVRRLHDIDRTGWWMLLYLTGIGAIVIFIFNVLRGTPGPNRFGPDPLTYFP